MPPVQTLYHELSATCSKCGDYLAGHGSELPPAEGGKRQYLCQQCTELKQELEILGQDGIEKVKGVVKMLSEVLQSPLFEAQKWGSRRIEASKPCDSLSQAYASIFEARDRLGYLIKESQY